MNRRLFGAFGATAVLTLTLGACKSDPFSDLDQTPAALVKDYTYLQINQGTGIAVTASVVDGRATPLPIPVTFSACNAVVSVAADTSYHPVPATSSRSIVTGVSTNPSCVVVQGAGFTDTIDVTVVPPTFAGALSDTIPLGGDTMTIASTAQFKFSPADVGVTFGGNNDAVILSATADTIRLLVPFSAPGQLRIAGIAVTYRPGLVITRPSTLRVTQTGDFWAGSNSFATAPAIPLPAASGDSVIIVGTMPIVNNADQCAETEANFDFGSEGPCVIFKFTVADTTTLHFVVDWDTDGDVDTYACSAPDPLSCFEDGGSGAGASQPEEFEFTFDAGTHYLVAEKFVNTRPANVKVTVFRP
jgi:hypothetical protein